MSKKGYLIGAIIVVVVIFFILFGGGGDKTKPKGNDVISKSVVVTLGTENNSGISGTATISDDGGKAKVVLSLIGSPNDIAEPAHIHIGSCAELGSPKYTLTSAKNGVSETTLDVPVSEVVQSGPLAVNVHKSASEVNVYVACGDITDPTVENKNAIEDKGSQTGETAPQ